MCQTRKKSNASALLFPLTSMSALRSLLSVALSSGMVKSKVILPWEKLADKDIWPVHSKFAEVTASIPISTVCNRNCKSSLAFTYANK